jgi:hypothetical protein
LFAPGAMPSCLGGPSAQSSLRSSFHCAVVSSVGGTHSNPSGAVAPRMKVERRLYRLRFLNASNALVLGNDRDGPVLLKFIAGAITGIGWLIDGLWPLGEREHRALHDFPPSTHVVSTRAPVVRPAPPSPPPARQLAPAIQRHLAAAYAAAGRIRDAIQRAQLPYVEVSREVDSLLAVMGRSAERAQMLHEALAEKPVAVVQARMEELVGSGKVELVNALGEQLEVQRRLQTQLGAFDDEMERIVVELETIRSSLLNVSASTDVGVHEQLASQVTTLRDEMSSVAAGMSAAFDRGARVRGRSDTFSRARVGPRAFYSPISVRTSSSSGKNVRSRAARRKPTPDEPPVPRL